MIGALYLVAVSASWFGTWGLVRRFGRTPSLAKVVPALVVVSVSFLAIDVVGIARGWFATPTSATLGALPGVGAIGVGLPIEELVMLPFLAWLVIALDSLRAAPRARTVRNKRVDARRRRGAAILLLLGGSFVALLLHAPEYAIASAAIGAAGFILAARILTARVGARIAVIGMVLLTVVFDNVLCRVGVFSYPGEMRTGVQIGLVPIEDVAWAIGFACFTLFVYDAVGATRGSAWRALLASRPAAWANTALPFLGGLAATRASAPASVALPLVLWWTVGYNALLYGINDLYDRASDLLNPRKGGAQGAQLALRDLPLLRSVIWIAGASGLAVALLAASASSTASAVVLVAIGAACLYSAPWLGRTRGRPIVDALTSAVHFTLPPLCGLAVGSAALGQWIAPLAAFFAWNVANHLVGAIQDRDADTGAHIATTATRFGARGTARFAIAWYAVSSFILAIAGTQSMGYALGALLPVVSAVSTVPLLRRSATADDARAAWRRFMVLNVPLGAAASVLLITSWQ